MFATGLRGVSGAMRADVCALLEDRRASDEGCFVPIDTLDKAAPASRHFVHEFGLAEPQAVKIDLA